MKFEIDSPPPSEDDIIEEKNQILEEIKRVKTLDTITSFLIILVSCIVAGLAVFWATNNITYAAIAASVFPVLSILLSLAGVTNVTGFRSAAMKLIDLEHTLVSLSEISEDNRDVTALSNKYPEIKDYREKTQETGRKLVNGELAMFWDWDTSTMAQEDKARDFVEKAKSSITD